MFSQLPLSAGDMSLADMSFRVERFLYAKARSCGGLLLMIRKAKCS